MGQTFLKLFRNCGRCEEGILATRKAIHRGPASLYARTCLASCFALLGRNHKAQAEAAETLWIDPKFSLVNLGKQAPYKDRADRERVIGALRKTGLK